MADRELRVLLVLPGFARGSTFVDTDYGLLSKHFSVTRLYRETGDRLFPARVARHLRRHDVAVTWFADTHAYWTVRAGRWLGRPVIVIPGQYEFSESREGGYGLVLESGKRFEQACRVVSQCDLVVAVSEYHAELIRKGQRRAAPIRLVYHGFDLETYKAPVETVRAPTVLTVAHAGSRARVWHKGLDTFARAAARLPEARFVLVGGYDPEVGAELQDLAEGRLEMLGPMGPERVAQTMGEARVYAQLSATETFGCALAEAMLCGCVPVVTDRGSLPEVAGEVGYYAPYGDVEATVRQVGEALASDRGPAARERIRRSFPMEKREQALVDIVKRLAGRC